MKQEMVKYKKKQNKVFAYIMATFTVFVAIFILNASKAEWVTITEEIKKNSTKRHQIQDVRNDLVIKDTKLFNSQEALKKRNNELRWEQSKKKIEKKWRPDLDKLVQYAYDKWWKDFVLTLNAENWTWEWDRKSWIVWANGYSDYWHCQLNAMYHWKFIFKNWYNLKSWFSDDFKDSYKQIDYCNWIFKDWIKRWRIKTTFYWYNVRHKSEKDFINL